MIDSIEDRSRITQETPKNLRIEVNPVRFLKEILEEISEGISSGIPE